MAAHKKWTEDLLAILLNEWEHIPDAGYLAEKYGLSKQRIYQLIHMAGLPVRERKADVSVAPSLPS